MHAHRGIGVDIPVGVRRSFRMNMAHARLLPDFTGGAGVNTMGSNGECLGCRGGGRAGQQRKCTKKTACVRNPPM